jgi:hypothetical protein
MLRSRAAAANGCRDHSGLGMEAQGYIEIIAAKATFPHNDIRSIKS